MDTCMKCAFLGKNIEPLYNHIKNIEGLKIAEVNKCDDDIWKDIEVAFIVCEVTNEEDFAQFKSVLNNANEKTNVVFPIIISQNIIHKKVLNVNPSKFESEDKMYEYVVNSIKSITESVTVQGLVNLDVEDLNNVLEFSDNWDFAYGESSGDNALLDAINMAISTKGQELSKITAIIFDVSGSEDNISMYKIQEGAEMLHDKCDGVNILWGAKVNNDLGDKIKVYIWLLSCDDESHLII